MQDVQQCMTTEFFANVFGHSLVIMSAPTCQSPAGLPHKSPVGLTHKS